MDIPAQAVQPCNQELGFVNAAETQSFGLSFFLPLSISTTS